MKAAFSLAIVGLMASAVADADWSDYSPGTLHEIVDRHTEILGEADTLLVPGLKRTVHLEFGGEIRPLSDNARSAIAEWVFSMQLSTDIAELFHAEALFRESGTEYWLPIQQQLVPHLEEEVAAGDSAVLYVLWIGYEAPTWIFLINEFQAVEPENSRRGAPDTRH
ncbi:MAG: hypothetical protein QNI99_20215 [Woeseiaceae bacterium]|nr:hypothetical protein [Woeseiaceae bacterium]